MIGAKQIFMVPSSQVFETTSGNKQIYKQMYATCCRLKISKRNIFQIYEIEATWPSDWVINPNGMKIGLQS